ncbi:MAG: hypothetical protein HOP23_14015 [Methylococcaceae bacterium]|nr:hypothetical protein [Methylococcaceae bacterium]
MQQKIAIELDTGTLSIDLSPGHVPLKRLLGFAARISSKRKFLLVSKVLGKHYPVTPTMMRWSYRALARQTLKNVIHQPSLWIGMAETATGLGYGVFEQACQAGAQQTLLMQTTRYHLEGLPRLAFEEAHSHATDFFLYYPDKAEYQNLFVSAETLVLIDDEISTGKTFLRLIKAYQQINRNLRQVFIVSLVNFAHPEDKQFLESEAGIPVQWIALRQGLLNFEARPNKALDDITVNVSGNGECKKHLLAWPGRLGMETPIELVPDVLQQLLPFFNTPDDGRPVLVLGTGECNAPAYLLGRVLETQGLKVKVQSTTRSPIHQGHDIQQICRFEDNYQDAIPNFLYNMDPANYREIILCHETPLCQPLLDRLNEWHAISARFELCPTSSHAKLHFFRP